MPRCVKLNNYWCIKSAGWSGEIGTDDEGHVGFVSAERGRSAAATLLRRRYLEFGRKSALDIVPLGARRMPPGRSAAPRPSSPSAGSAARCGRPSRRAAESACRRRSGREPRRRPDAAHLRRRSPSAAHGPNARHSGRHTREAADLRRARCSTGSLGPASRQAAARRTGASASASNPAAKPPLPSRRRAPGRSRAQSRRPPPSRLLCLRRAPLLQRSSVARLAGAPLPPPAPRPVLRTRRAAPAQLCGPHRRGLARGPRTTSTLHRGRDADREPKPVMLAMSAFELGTLRPACLVEEAVERQRREPVASRARAIA